MPVPGPATTVPDRPVAAIIQARMSSTRLPGKVLRPLGGRPVLDWVIRAAEASGVCDHIVVATSTDPSDDPVAAFGADRGIRVHRGPLDDVLARFIGALHGLAPSMTTGGVVRLTADCPLLDPSLIASVVNCWQTSASDYVSTIEPRSLPRGLDVELVDADVLRRLDETATGVHRIHVTSHINTHPESFDRMGIVVSPAADDLRVTLDTEEDGQLLDALVERIGDRPPSWKAVVRELRSDPTLRALNEQVVQKAIEEG